MQSRALADETRDAGAVDAVPACPVCQGTRGHTMRAALL